MASERRASVMASEASLGENGQTDGPASECRWVCDIGWRAERMNGTNLRQMESEGKLNQKALVLVSWMVERPQWNEASERDICLSRF